MKHQKILTIMTTDSSIRSEAEGWSGEDGKVVLMDKPVGLSRGLREYHTYPTPLHAMGDGWRLMAPQLRDTTAKQKLITGGLKNMNRAFRKAAVLAMSNPNLTNEYIQGCIDEYAAVNDEQLKLDLVAKKVELKAAGRGTELTDAIDSMWVALACRKAVL